MPIYEYYSPDTHKIYSFYAKTIAQGQQVPRCPDHPEARMVKLLSAFAIGGGRKQDEAEGPPAGGEAADDAHLGKAMEAMERELAGVDENDPRAMARMMRRMAELGGEKLDESMEEAVRKLEEGADPESVEEQLGAAFGDDFTAEPSGSSVSGPSNDESAKRAKRLRFTPRSAPTRDPRLYDYE